VLQLGRKRFRDPLSLALIAVTFTLMSILKLSLPIVLLLVFPVALWLNRPGARP
jgi:chromate transporter